MNELSLLAQEVGVSERTLRRAVNEGSLRAVKLSPRRLRLSVSEARFVRRSWSLVSTLRELLRNEKSVRLALLFGSTAKAEDDDSSDVDIIVSMRSADFDRLVDLSVKLSQGVGRYVDIIRFEDAEADQDFFVEALSSARVLVDRENYWSRLRANTAAARESAVDFDDELCKALAAIDRLLAG